MNTFTQRTESEAPVAADVRRLRLSFHKPVIRPPLTRPSGTLSPPRRRGEGWGEGWPFGFTRTNRALWELLEWLPKEVRASLRRLLQVTSAIRLLAATACLLTAGCNKPKADTTKPHRDEVITVTVATVETVKADRTVPIVGTLAPKDEATVSAEVEGKVESTSVDFGDRVTANQELTQIDTTTYAALTRQAAANVVRAKAAAENAALNLKRVLELKKNGIATGAELELATAQADQTAAEVHAAEAADSIAGINLTRSQVRAPFDSAIAERFVNKGDFVHIGAPLFRIVNDRLIKYLTSVPERFAAEVKKDQPVCFTVDTHPGETFTGKVLLISPTVNTKTRMLTFGALVQNADLRLKANAYARGELILERDVPMLVVPLDAVINFSGLNKVFVVENNIAQAREVKVGRIKDGKQEVQEGLKAGESVVVTGQAKLVSGSKVEVKQTAARNDQ